MLARANFSDYIIGLLFAAQVCLAQTPQTKEAFEAFAAGDYRVALKLYTEVLNANPADTSARFYQGLCHLNLGEYEQGKYTLWEVALSKTYRARAHYFIAKAEETSGKIYEALSTVRWSLRADSTFAPAKKLLAQLLCATRQYAAALKTLDSTATSDALLALGNCLAASGRYEEAAAVAKRALAVDSTNFAAKLLLAEAFSYSDSAKRACEIYYQLYNRASSHPRILKKLAACYLKDGQHQTALSFLKIYLAATGDSSVSVLADIGRIFHSISRFDSAAVYFDLAVQRDSTAAIHHFNLGLAYYQLKKYRDAERELRKAIALSQETLALISKEQYMLGAACMNQNKNKSAIQAYRKSADLNPEYVEAYYFLGTIYRSLGDQTNAATWFRRFLQRAPKEKRYQHMRTDARQSLKSINAAKQSN